MATQTPKSIDKVVLIKYFFLHLFTRYNFLIERLIKLEFWGYYINFRVIFLFFK